MNWFLGSQPVTLVVKEVNGGMKSSFTYEYYPKEEEANPMIAGLVRIPGGQTWPKIEPWNLR